MVHDLFIYVYYILWWLYHGIILAYSLRWLANDGIKPLVNFVYACSL